MSGTAHLTKGSSWEAMRRAFRWEIPQRYNIAHAACTVWAEAEPDRRALSYIRPDGAVRDYSYIELERAACRFANALRAHGVGQGDRVAILLPQTPETVIAHLASYKIGAITVPLTTLFGADGLSVRLRDAGVRAIVTDGANLEKLFEIRDALPDLAHIFSVDIREGGVSGFWQELGKAADRCEAVPTGPDDPALLSYTSGTTGPPKGALHAHRVLIGHLPGVVLPHEFLPEPGDCLWTPADWAWLGGLCNVMLPALALGVPLIAHRMARFDPERAFDIIARHGVRNTFLPPTALKLMRQVARPPGPVGLRTVASGGEALGAELLAWGDAVFGRAINEFYGQTECNLVLANAASVFPPRPGAMGKPVPGHDVAVLDGAGAPRPPGEMGEIAVRRPDPAMFLGYWNRPETTAAKFRGDWMLTGDLATLDGEGYVHFSARNDDVITSSGYRIGPTEIEECLAGHGDVAMAAVIGVPDPVRTEVVKAFVVPRHGAVIEGLAAALTDRVRQRISPHVAPVAVAFVEALPMTATGKIMRKTLREAEA